MRRPARLLALCVFTSFLAPAIVAPAFAEDEVADQASGDQEVESRSEPPLYDLTKLLDVARASYPGMRAADARIRAAQAQLDEAWVSPFFQTTVTAGVGLSPAVRGTPIFTNAESQVPLDQAWEPILGFDIQGGIPLWTWGKLPGARDAARAGIRAAESDRVRVRNQLMHDVRKAYFGYQLALDIEQMFREGLPQIEQALARIEERLADGDPEVSDIDRYRLSTALAEVRARRAQATHGGQTAHTAISILTGVREFRVPDCPLTRVEATLKPRGEYVEHALHDRPEMRMIDAGRRAREASLDIARAGFLPDIALTYRFGRTYAPGVTDQVNPFVIDPANYTNIGAGLAMRWSLDFWGNAYRVDRETALLADLRERAEEARRGIELEVTDAYEAVVEAQAREVAYSAGTRDARAWMITALQAIELGTGHANDLVDAVRTYFTARYNHLQAIFDTNTGLAVLERTAAIEVTEQWENSCL